MISKSTNSFKCVHFGSIFYKLHFLKMLFCPRKVLIYCLLSIDLEYDEWSGFGLPDELLNGLDKLQIVRPTAVQCEALSSAIRERRDMLLAAETVCLIGYIYIDYY